MRYRDLETWVTGVLEDAGYPKVPIKPGPEQPKIPSRYVLLTLYGGPGMDADGALDDVSWQIRVVGMQGKYEDAENMANAIDIACLSWQSARLNGDGPWCTRIQRVGGAPTPLLVDDADRTHFACSYIFGVELALTN